MKYRLMVGSILLHAVTLSAQGQVPTPDEAPDQTVPAAPVKPKGSPDPHPAATAASTLGLLGGSAGLGSRVAVSALYRYAPIADAPETPRMTRLKQLQFDRRPATILNVWVERPDTKASSPKEVPSEPLDVELKLFQKQVTLGDWPSVKTYLRGLPQAEGKAAYKQLLLSLQGAPGTREAMMRGPDGELVPRKYPEINAITAEDVIGLAASAPGDLDKESLASLGAILRLGLDGHTVAPDVAIRFKAEITKGEKKAAFSTRQAAQLLVTAGEPVAAGLFLPGLDKAIADKDSQGLNLLARHFLGVHASEKKAVYLERAWSSTQAVLALGRATVEEKAEALRRAVELAPKIKEQFGQTWLDQSFTNQRERGMDILATIGSLASRGLEAKPDRDERLKTLRLQKTAVEALLKAAPQLATKWQRELGMLAGIWMREAAYTMQMDSGNGGGRRVVRRGGRTMIFWGGDPDQSLLQQNLPLPIHPADLLLARPESGWIAKLDNGPRSKLAGLLAHLFLKAGDEKMAFPLIEELAPTDKEATRELVNEFLTVWTTSHDPNASRSEDDPFMSGFYSNSGGTPDSIPLTRSKQERNLVELAGWVERLRRLPVDRLDEDLLVDAFTRCHSRAEVYRLDAIEKVFGPKAKIKPRTLATLIQSTRANLAGLWREPANQQKQKTNRKQKDIEFEVLRGYELAGAVVADALKQFPDDWSLSLARAALLHDETNYRQEVAKNADYTKKREEALANFQRAGALYADQVKKLAEDEETIALYQQWFHASLGACDLSQIDDDKLSDPRQPPLIRKAILALPGEMAERHMNKMADALAGNLSLVKPAARHRYLKQAFEIIGDNKQGAGIKKIFDYYKDLITEIKLDVVVDGSDNVGYQQPFGVFVNIRHTREIERESGGFGRYLQNQNSGGVSYNFGRNTADYRDRFQSIVTEALKEQFEILSITFQSDKVHSRAIQEFGWRMTPYAYLLLKPRGPQVDKIPPLHLDLDFIDTTADFSDSRRAAGYVILPIESPAVPIDAASERGLPRPLRKLQITQILDERQADKGILGLEIKATGVGLVGPLTETLVLEPEGFAVVQAKDQGVSVAKFDDEGENNTLVSERTWLVQLQAKDDRAVAPTTFQFGNPRAETAEMLYQRYKDADLVLAKQVVDLEYEYRGRSAYGLWLWGIVGGGVLCVMIIAVLKMLQRRPRRATGFKVPETLDPFTATVILRRIRQDGKLGSSDQKALDQVMEELEHRFFADSGANGAEFDLRNLTEDWVRRSEAAHG